MAAFQNAASFFFILGLMTTPGITAEPKVLPSSPKLLNSSLELWLTLQLFYQLHKKKITWKVKGHTHTPHPVHIQWEMSFCYELTSSHKGAPYSNVSLASLVPTSTYTLVGGVEQNHWTFKMKIHEGQTSQGGKQQQHSLLPSPLTVVILDHLISSKL